MTILANAAASATGRVTAPNVWGTIVPAAGTTWTPSAELWILFTGFWSDDKYWLDSAEWNDTAWTEVTPAAGTTWTPIAA
jgi:hypothetical protein